MMKKLVDSELPSSMGDDCGGREEWRKKTPMMLNCVLLPLKIQYRWKYNVMMTKLMMSTLCPTDSLPLSFHIVDIDVKGSEDCCSDYKKKMRRRLFFRACNSFAHERWVKISIMRRRSIPKKVHSCLSLEQSKFSVPRAWWGMKNPSEYAGCPIANAATCFTRILFCNGWRPWDGHTPGQNSSLRPQVRRNCLTSTWPVHVVGRTSSPENWSLRSKKIHEVWCKPGWPKNLQM